jgi:hypothetical protein
VSRAEPLLYADRAERYLTQRGIPYDEHTVSWGHLTPAQRRRSLHKERRAWRRIGEARRDG